jgi:Fe2+ or Zn2+ uptake regulation protein
MTATGGDQARHMLKDAGLYCTKARMAVLGVLMEASSPLAQDQIAEEPTVAAFDKVTIYRTLDCLTQVGLVHRAFMHKRAWHFELANHCSERQCHPHFTCVDCGKTHCLTDTSLPLVEIPHHGFVVNRQQVRLEGLCPDCSARRTSEANTNVSLSRGRSSRNQGS